MRRTPRTCAAVRSIHQRNGAHLAARDTGSTLAEVERVAGASIGTIQGDHRDDQERRELRRSARRRVLGRANTACDGSHVALPIGSRRLTLRRDPIRLGLTKRLRTRLASAILPSAAQTICATHPRQAAEMSRLAREGRAGRCRCRSSLARGFGMCRSQRASIWLCPANGMHWPEIRINHVCSPVKLARGANTGGRIDLSGVAMSGEELADAGHLTAKLLAGNRRAIALVAKAPCSTLEAQI